MQKLISSTMYDFFNGTNVGIVFFMPFDSSCTHITSVHQAQAQLSTGIYPNPASGTVSIKWSVKGKSKPTILILNALGYVVREFREIDTTGQEINVDISELAAGLYFVEILSDGEKVVKKLCKM